MTTFNTMVDPTNDRLTTGIAEESRNEPIDEGEFPQN